MPSREEPGGLQSMGSEGIRHDLVTKTQPVPPAPGPPSLQLLVTTSQLPARKILPPGGSRLLSPSCAQNQPYQASLCLRRRQHLVSGGPHTESRMGPGSSVPPPRWERHRRREPGRGPRHSRWGSGLGTAPAAPLGESVPHSPSRGPWNHRGGRLSWGRHKAARDLSSQPSPAPPSRWLSLPDTHRFPPFYSYLVMTSLATTFLPLPASLLEQHAFVSSPPTPCLNLLQLTFILNTTAKTLPDNFVSPETRVFHPAPSSVLIICCNYHCPQKHFPRSSLVA